MAHMLALYYSTSHLTSSFTTIARQLSFCNLFLLCTTISKLQNLLEFLWLSRQHACLLKSGDFCFSLLSLSHFLSLAVALYAAKSLVISQSLYTFCLSLVNIPQLGIKWSSSISIGLSGEVWDGVVVK